MGKLTLSKFRVLCAEAGLLVPATAVDLLFKAVMEELGEKPHEAKANRFIARYVELYEEHRGTKIRPTGKDRGIAKTVVKDLGEDYAITLLEHFFVIKDQYIMNREYDLGQFSINIRKLETSLQTGKSVTQTQARKLEKTHGIDSKVASFLSRTKDHSDE